MKLLFDVLSIINRDTRVCLCGAQQCARVSLVTLTLARFILETSLMDVRYVTYRDSHVAASCLWLAMRMKSEGHWVSDAVTVGVSKEVML